MKNPYEEATKQAEEKANVVVEARRRTYVPPSGDISTAKIAFVGDQPGRVEIRQGKPFTGPAGQELLTDMHAVGLSRGDCYFTDVIKDFDNPLKNYIDFTKKGVVISDAGKLYIDSLFDEFDNFSGIIIPVGNVPLYAFTGRTGITKWRGSVLRSSLSNRNLVVPTLHPATVIPPKNQFLNRLLIQFDLKKALGIVNDGHEPLERKFIIRPTYGECLTFLNNCIGQGLDGTAIAFDIEIHNMEVSCISFAYGADKAISIPFMDSKGDYMSIEQETEIWKRIAEILESSAIWKIAQNAIFDSHFLLRRYGIKTVNVHDTMIAQQILMPDFTKGLDFITSIWTDLPYYKDEGKKFFKTGGRWETLWEYNARDSIVCAEAFPKQFSDLKKQGNERTYLRQREMVEPLTYMMEHGIKVDVEGMVKASKEMGEQIEKLQEELNEACGRELNVNSPKQMREYFYGTLGHPAYKKRGTKAGVTTDNLAMKRLIRKGVKQAKIVLEIRKLRKLKSTYIPIDEDGKLTKVDDDGRIRCSYNPVGTRYSRLSSSESIFEKGMNMQNWPHAMKTFLVADEGYIYYSFDLAQAENRIVAYCADETKMIQAFEEGQDVHSLTAALIFQKDPKDITREDNTCPLGDGTHGERFWGKKANHGLNYDLGYKSFALLYEMPERDAKFIVDRYHKAYPGVRQRFHAYVRKSLSESRTLVNPMGRRTLFLDKWGDSLFKEAYSCIPQGTVGDVINERGLEYIYYNQQDFGPVELLDQVHDSIGFQIPIPNGSNKIQWADHAKMLLKIKKSLETPLTIRNYTFTIPADLTIGFNMGEGKELKGDNFPTNEFDLINKLAQTYKGLLNV